MGIFFKSESDRIKEQIVDEINKINHKLKQLEAILNNGLCDNNADQFCDLIDDVSSYLNTSKSKMNGLSIPQLSKLALPWVDGSYIPVYLWDISFKHVMAQVNSAFEQYTNYKTS